MNWRRALFLLWIVGTVLFVLAVAFGRYSEIKTEFEALVTSLAQTIARNRIAADNNLTLACQGTSIFKMFAWKGPTQEGQPEPISIGIIVNLTKRTVTGLDEKPPLTEPRRAPALVEGRL